MEEELRKCRKELKECRKKLEMAGHNRHINNLCKLYVLYNLWHWLTPFSFLDMLLFLFAIIMLS